MGSITRGIANNILGSGAVDGTDGLSGTVPANNIANASLNNLTSLPPSVQAGIPSVASNPSPVSEGDVWYNNVAFKLRVQGKAISSASWSSGGSMNVASHARSGIGQVNTAVLAVGVDPAPQGRTELYNGSSWTEVGDLNNGRRYTATFGTTSAGVAAGGASPPGYNDFTETWNGSAWTEVNDINTSRGYWAGFGTSTAGLGVGGEPDSHDTKVESWDGTNWTEVAEVNTGVRQFARGGHTGNSDGIKAGGYTGTAHTANAETWNGTTWTEVNNLNTSRYSLAGDGSGSLEALAYGGYTSTNVANTESWDGSSWTEVGDLATARNNLGGAGISGSSLAFGANPASSATEEFTAPTAALDVTLTS